MSKISKGVKDTMWHFLMQGTHTFTNEDIEELTEAVNRLIKMTTQKTAGQRRNTTHINWETLDMEFMRIVCYATALVLSGRLEELREFEGGGTVGQADIRAVHRCLRPGQGDRSRVGKD